MTESENKKTVRRIYEAMNNKEIDVIESMLADDFKYVGPSTREQDWEGLKRVIAADTSGVPDAIFSIRRLVAEGDTVIAEYIWSGTHTGEHTRARAYAG